MNKAGDCEGQGFGEYAGNISSQSPKAFGICNYSNINNENRKG